MTFVQMVHRLYKIKHLELGLWAYTFSLLSSTRTVDIGRVFLFNDFIDVKSKNLYCVIVKPTDEWRNNDEIKRLVIDYSYNEKGNIN